TSLPVTRMPTSPAGSSWDATSTCTGPGCSRADCWARCLRNSWVRRCRVPRRRRERISPRGWFNSNPTRRLHRTGRLRHLRRRVPLRCLLHRQPEGLSANRSERGSHPRECDPARVGPPLPAATLGAALRTGTPSAPSATRTPLIYWPWFRRAWVGLVGVCHEDRYVALGCEDRQGRFDDVMLLVGDQLVQGSVYRLLADHGDALFSDEYFADLFKRSALGRPTVPARVVATVMLLQAYEGLSDREACDRLAFDLRWKAAAGLTVEAGAFHPTVLVGMRNRLRASDRPRRLFDDVNTTARTAGLLRGRRRVIDSTPLFDAVATQDTVIQLRAAIRKVLTAADRSDPALAGAVRAALTRDDDYATLGKPPCDWDDRK